MEIVTKTGLFGNSFFERKERTVPKGGLCVKKPLGGDFFIYDGSDGLIHDSSEYPGGVVSFKKADKKAEKNIEVVFVNTSPVACQGSVPVSAFDDGDSVDWLVAYDVDIAYSAGRAEQFMKFILGNHLLNGMAGYVFPKLALCVESVIKEVIGSRDEEAVEKINADNLRIAGEVLSRLNSVGGGLYDYGFTATKFSFNVADDYMHREEKKRIQRNRRITGKI